MDYKKIIIEMLDHANQKQLRMIYIHIRALLGLRSLSPFLFGWNQGNFLKRSIRFHPVQPNQKSGGV